MNITVNLKEFMDIVNQEHPHTYSPEALQVMYGNLKYTGETVEIQNICSIFSEFSTTLMLKVVLDEHILYKFCDKLCEYGYAKDDDFEYVNISKDRLRREIAFVIDKVEDKQTIVNLLEGYGSGEVFYLGYGSWLVKNTNWT